MFGHMNNVTPFVYFEEARISYFKHLGVMDRLSDGKSAAIPVVASQQCDYFQQVMLHERLKSASKQHLSATPRSPSITQRKMGKAAFALQDWRLWCKLRKIRVNP